MGRAITVLRALNQAPVRSPMANPNLHFFFLQDPATDELRYAYRFRHTSRVFRSADRADQSHFGKDAS